MTEADRAPLFAVASDPLISAHDRWQHDVFDAFMAREAKRHVVYEIRRA